MNTLKRTSKQFNKETVREIVIELLAIGGLSNYPYKLKKEDIRIEEHYVNKFEGGHSSPYDPKEKGEKYLHTVELSHENFDTRVIIGQNGYIQGYYVKSGNQNYAPNPLKFINLLLKYNFLTCE